MYIVPELSIYKPFLKGLWFHKGDGVVVKGCDHGGKGGMATTVELKVERANYGQGRSGEG